MITDLWIENFKGIGKRQHIPLRPITLLFGANSAGKSTVLHALLYLREVLTNKNPDPKANLGASNTMNLGGYSNIVHQRDVPAPIRALRSKLGPLRTSPGHSLKEFVNGRNLRSLFCEDVLGLPKPPMFSTAETAPQIEPLPSLLEVISALGKSVPVHERSDLAGIFVGIGPGNSDSDSTSLSILCFEQESSSSGSMAHIRARLVKAIRLFRMVCLDCTFGGSLNGQHDRSVLPPPLQHPLDHRG